MNIKLGRKLYSKEYITSLLFDENALIDFCLNHKVVKQSKDTELYFISKSLRDKYNLDFEKTYKTSLTSNIYNKYSLLELAFDNFNLWEHISDQDLIKYDSLGYQSSIQAEYTTFVKELKHRGLLASNPLWVYDYFDKEKQIPYRRFEMERTYYYIENGEKQYIFLRKGLSHVFLQDKFLIYTATVGQYFIVPKDHQSGSYDGFPLEYILAFDLDSCEECGRIDLLNEEHLCNSCRTTEEILPYNTKAEELLPFKGKREDTFLGIELELATEYASKKQTIQTKKLLKGHCILKHDSSIGSGFEIVSCPATYDIHIKEFENFFKQIPSFFKPTNKCGMHVHVDKSKLSLLQIGKLNAFINNKENTKFIESIAGRTQNSYCSKLPELGEKYSNTYGYDRYRALNLTKKTTIEFRIFASTVSFEVFKRNLQFVKALITYTSPGNMFSKKLEEHKSHISFKNWIISLGKKQYPELYNFILSLQKGV